MHTVYKQFGNIRLLRGSEHLAPVPDALGAALGPLSECTLLVAERSGGSTETLRRWRGCLDAASVDGGK